MPGRNKWKIIKATIIYLNFTQIKPYMALFIWPDMESTNI